MYLIDQNGDRIGRLVMDEAAAETFAATVNTALAIVQACNMTEDAQVH